MHSKYTVKHLIYIRHSVCGCTFLIVGQTARLIWIKHGIRTQLDQVGVLVKVNVKVMSVNTIDTRSEALIRVGADSVCPEDG